MIHAVIVSVGYGDYLAETLPKNNNVLPSITVVTSPDDEETLTVCMNNDVPVEMFGRGKGVEPINKGLYMDIGLQRVYKTVAQPNDWYLALDADIIVPNMITGTEKLDRHYIYGAPRFVAKSSTDLYRPLSKLERVKDVAIAYGYFQLFGRQESYVKHCPTPEYSDSLFRQKFSKSVELPGFHVLHLGTPVVNWRGRVSPRWQ